VITIFGCAYWVLADRGARLSFPMLWLGFAPRGRAGAHVAFGA
jgi:hypothetical protein